MKCMTCGFENPDGSKFCQSCGSSLEITAPSAAPGAVSQEKPVMASQQAQPMATPMQEQKIETVTPTPKKTNNNMILKIGIGAIILLVIVVFFSFAFIKGDKYDMIKNDYDSYYQKDEGKTTIFYNNKEIKDKVDGSIDDFQTNYDDTFAAFIAFAEEDDSSDSEESEDYTSDNSDTGTLYTLTKNKLKKIEDDVTNVFDVADNGKVFAYEDSDGFTYFCKNGKSTKVAEDAGNVIISPDGKSMVYSTHDEEDTVLYYFDGKKSEEIGENMTARLLSNGGKYVYYTKDDGDLYVASAKKPDKSTKIASTDDGNSPIIVGANKDRTQILYSLGEKTYFVNKGNADKKVKVANTSSMMPIVPGGAGYLLDDLRNQFYIGSSGDLYYVNKKAESEKIASELSDYQMSDDGKTIYYSKGEDLYILNTKKMNDAKKIADDIYNFEMLPNGKAAYYTDESDTLFYIKGKGDPKRVTDDVESFEVTHDGIALFLKDVDDSKGDGTLYYSKKGGKAKKIADDIFDIWTTPYASYYTTNVDSDDYTRDIYIAKSGTKFKEMIKGVS